jgi:flagellin FlaB
VKNKFLRTLRTFHRGEKGITGLETAIILIAFVTVASVLAYSVLSAGIFSAEKGKQTVYSGLAQAQSSMQIRGDVLALSSDNTNVGTIQFTLASVLGDEAVDMTATAGGKNSVVMNYNDPNRHDENVGWTATHLGQSNFGDNMLGPGEAMLITVTVPTGANLGAYGSFTLQVVPTKGAAITIQRSLPASILPVIDLH